MVPPLGFEPRTYWLRASCSKPLSYRGNYPPLPRTTGLDWPMEALCIPVINPGTEYQICQLRGPGGNRTPDAVRTWFTAKRDLYQQSTTDPCYTDEPSRGAGGPARSQGSSAYGVANGIRTRDLLLGKQTLYPAEL